MIHLVTPHIMCLKADLRWDRGMHDMIPVTPRIMCLCGRMHKSRVATVQAEVSRAAHHTPATFCGGMHSHAIRVAPHISTTDGGGNRGDALVTRSLSSS